MAKVMYKVTNDRFYAEEYYADKADAEMAFLCMLDYMHNGSYQYTVANPNAKRQTTFKVDGYGDKVFYAFIEKVGYNQTLIDETAAMY